MSADVVTFPAPPRVQGHARSVVSPWSEVIAAVEADMLVYVIEGSPGRHWLAFEIAQPAPRQSALQAAIVMRDRFATNPAFRDHVIRRAVAQGTYRAGPDRQP